MTLFEYLEIPMYAETEEANKSNDPMGNSGTAVYSSDSATIE